MDRTIRITEIRVKYHLPLERDQEETARRVFDVHPRACPAHESVKDSIRIKLDVEFDWR